MKAEELDWRAEEDARTLARAEEVKLDKERYQNAVKAAQVLTEQDNKRANAMAKVAGKNKHGNNCNCTECLQRRMRQEIANL